MFGDVCLSDVWFWRYCDYRVYRFVEYVFNVCDWCL